MRKLRAFDFAREEFQGKSKLLCFLFSWILVITRIVYFFRCLLNYFFERSHENDFDKIPQKLWTHQQNLDNKVIVTLGPWTKEWTFLNKPFYLLLLLLLSLSLLLLLLFHFIAFAQAGLECQDIPLGQATTSSQGPRGCFHLICLRLSWVS